MPSALRDKSCQVPTLLHSSLEWDTNTIIGQHVVIKKGDPAVVGITQLKDGLTLEDLKRPWKTLPVEASTTSTSSTTPPP